jgi:protein-S-isoprenylcysteine O-methyltransferase Ste14
VKIGLRTSQVGTVLMASTWPGLSGVVAMVVACQVQVRLDEEPYLLRSHGRAYQVYAATTGRFLPCVGWLAAAPAPSTWREGVR